MLYLAGLSLLTLAISAPLSTRNCPDPTYFQISGFNAFTAAPGPDNYSLIGFNFNDYATNVSTTCSRTLPPGSGRSPDDPDNYYSCDDTSVTYLFNGSMLAVKEEFECSGHKREKTAFANATLGLECYGLTPPYPGGTGTLCETPVASFQITVSSITKDTCS